MNIDYLTFSVRHTSVDVMRIVSLMGYRTSEVKPAKPMYFYNEGYEIGFARMYKGGLINPYTVTIVLSGKAMSEIRDRGCTDYLLIGYLKEVNANITRIDYALDVPYEYLRKYVESYESGNYVTRCREVTYIKNKIGGKLYGETLYIGSRKGDKFVRVYDKGAEQGREACTHARIEIVLKGDKVVTLPDDAWTLVKDIFRAVDRLDSNVSRSPVSRWWLDLFYSVYDLSVNFVPRIAAEPRKYYDRMRKWIIRSVSKYGLDVEAHFRDRFYSGLSGYV